MGIVSSCRDIETGAKRKLKLGEEEEDWEFTEESLEEGGREGMGGCRWIMTWACWAPSFQHTRFPSTPLSRRNTLYWYKLFYPQWWLEYIVGQSKNYATSHGRERKVSSITPSNIRCMEAVLLHTGYHSTKQEDGLGAGWGLP